jgi:hypothetical protein
MGQGAYMPGTLRSLTGELAEGALTFAEVDAVADRNLNGVQLKMEQAL